MIRSNTIAGGYLDLFLRGLALQPRTEYELHFDALGAPCFVWCDGTCIAKWPSPFITHYSDSWRSYCLRFTTGDQLQLAANWGISFNKQLDAACAAGHGTTYLDNVRLCHAEHPEVNLLACGDFEAPRGDEGYSLNWDGSFFGAVGRLYGVDIVPDPLNTDNHCLMLPRIVQPPQYTEDISLRADSFGCYQSMSHRIRDEQPHGLPQHRLLFVAEGSLRGTVNRRVVNVPTGHLLYIPPDTPADFTFAADKKAQYYWVYFHGAPAKRLLSACGIQGITTRSLPSIAAVCTHIDDMLNTPAGDILHPYAVSGHLQLLLAELHRQCITVSDDSYHPLIEQIALRLQEQPESFVSNRELAQSCGFSEGHFVRLFKKHKGCTPHRYHMHALADKACVLLKTTDMSIQEIAYSLGFDDPLYFSRLFRSVHGIPPRLYRQRHQ